MKRKLPERLSNMLTGGIFTGVTMERNSVLTEVYTLDEGEKAKLDTITFT